MKKWKRPFDRINDFLDRYVLPWPVRFLTFRFVILATIALLIPLILFSNNTTMVLGINSYLNTMSVAVSSIVLLYATLAEVRQKQIAVLQEKRAQEDHEHVTAMHTLIMQTLQNQNIEMQELKRVLDTLSGKEEPPESSGLSADSQNMKRVNEMKALHPRGEDRFEENDLNKRWQTAIHHNSLTNAIQEDFTAPEDY